MSTTLPVVNGCQLVAAAPLPDGSVIVVAEGLGGYVLATAPSLDALSWDPYQGHSLYDTQAEALAWLSARVTNAYRPVLYPKGY